MISGSWCIVSDPLSSFTFENCDGSSNVKLIGYSEALKQLFVEFKNNMRYIYNEVPKLIWDNWQMDKEPTGSKFGTYLAANIKGVFGFQAVNDTHIIYSSTPEAALQQLNDLGHFYDSSAGLWAIDQDPKIVDLDWIRRNAFELK